MSRHLLFLLVISTCLIVGCSLFKPKVPPQEPPVKPTFIEKFTGTAIASAKTAAKTVSSVQWLIPVGVLLMGLAVALGVTGNVKGGIAGFAGGGTVVALAVMLSQHAVLIATLTMALIIGLVVMVVLDLRKRQVKLKFSEQANTQLVETAEIVKPLLAPVDREEVFGKGKESGIAGEIQTRQTENIVKNIRKERGYLTA